MIPTVRNKGECEAVLSSDKFYQEGCKGLNGTERKNIPKFIIRELIKYVMYFPKKIYDMVKERFEITIMEFDPVLIQFRDMKQYEATRNDTNKTKDYKNLINRFAKYPIHHVILNASLENTMKKLNQGEIKKIKEANNKIYMNTIEALHRYSCSLLENYFNKINEPTIIQDIDQSQSGLELSNDI